MKPNTTNNDKNLSLNSNQGSISHKMSQKAAANIVRSQLDSIYSKQDSKETKRSEITTQEYLRKYHSAWQDYYKKYYEGYYSQHLQKQFEKTENPKQTKSAKRSDEEIIQEIREDLKSNIKNSTKRIKKSRHFIPISAGILAILVFVFLQYNQVVAANIISFISPGNIDPQNIIIDPNTSVVVSPEPRLIIPKINVDVPVLWDIPNDYQSQMDAMTKGVAHFAIPGAESHPGQIGNTIVSGHSSNDLLEGGNYKFIFAQLDKLNTGDAIFIHYQSTRYTYTVTKKEVVEPTDINKLTYQTDKPVLTLITCTPLGTNRFRLLVSAEQVSPDPEKATKVAAESTTKNTVTMPSGSKSFLEKLFGN